MTDWNTASREELILRYAPLVKYVASRLAAGLPQHVERADLVSYGMFGLIDAIDRFEPERGVKFETYATTRIRGSILDELRAMDWAPRSVRSRGRWVAVARETLEKRLGRRATPQEVADELGWTVEDVHIAHAESSDSHVGHLQTSLDDGTDTVLEPADVSNDDPVLETEVAITRGLLAKALVRLPERERIVATMYYREGLTLAEIGGVLGVTESRVCQLYTNAALAVRESIAVLR